MNKSLSLIAGILFAAAIASPAAFAADNPFAAPTHGTQMAAADAGKEMKCDAAMKAAPQATPTIEEKK